MAMVAFTRVHYYYYYDDDYNSNDVLFPAICLLRGHQRSMGRCVEGVRVGCL